MEQNLSNEVKVSKYNSALAQLYRIDRLWNLCHTFRRRGILEKWNETLDCVWTELASDSIEEDIKKFSSFIGSIIKNKKNGNNRSILYIILMNKEIFLRKLQNRQGKGTAYEDESEDDFD